MAISVLWITFNSISFDLCVFPMYFYGRFRPIFLAIKSFPPLEMTLVEHMLINLTQISLIGYLFYPFVQGPCAGNVCTSFWMTIHSVL